MKHDVQDGRDAAARARSGSWSRPRPIRFDTDTWLVMRNDPVLPAAVILRLREPSGRDFFVTVTWDLEPANRHMVGRYWNLDDADHAVLYTVADPVVGRPNEEMKALRRREEEHARELERQQADRANLYGP